MGDTIKLSTGREFYANQGIVGINGDLEVSEGYDGGIDGVELDAAEWSSRPWSTEDRVALAELMIERWAQFKSAASKAQKPPHSGKE